VQSVQRIFTKLLAKGYIYEGKYSGLYCVTCEEFLDPDQIDENGLCKVSGDKPQLVEEDTYFLKVSEFQRFLEKFLQTNTLIPTARRNEIYKNFVEPGVKDLSVTRVSFQ